MCCVKAGLYHCGEGLGGGDEEEAGWVDHPCTCAPNQWWVPYLPAYYLPNLQVPVCLRALKYHTYLAVPILSASFCNNTCTVKRCTFTARSTDIFSPFLYMFCTVYCVIDSMEVENVGTVPYGCLLVVDACDDRYVIASTLLCGLYRTGTVHYKSYGTACVFAFTLVGILSLLREISKNLKEIKWVQIRFAVYWEICSVRCSANSRSQWRLHILIGQISTVADRDVYPGSEFFLLLPGSKSIRILDPDQHQRI
jgi:hypothetical protein